MKNIYLLVILCFVAITSFGQKENNPIENLDFEISNGSKAKDWQVFGKGEYSVGIDSSAFISGKQSATIVYVNGSNGFKALAYYIPAIYAGKKIKLTGYIKTENVTNGYAGLWMRIDPSVSFDNMNTRGIKGTTDWEKYEIELNLKSSKAKRIVVGGLLTGEGKMWIDNLEVTIDGKPLAKTTLKELTAVEKDKEFVDASKIDSIELTDQNIENLTILAQIWGFLKYYHPNIAKAEYNWDFELFRIMPKIIDAKNTIERDKYLTNWIAQLGEFKIEEQPKKEKADVIIKADLEWINNSNLSSELVTALSNVKNANRTDENYYIKINKDIKNPDFNKEASYSEMKYPDVGFRLLSLYRYWNIIQYYFPYKNLIEEDWKVVLSEFIPKFINVENETEYQLVVLKLIARVHDTHAGFWDGKLFKYWGVNKSAISLTFIENKAIVSDYFDTGLAKETGLEIGDEITKINGKLVSEIIKDQLKYTPASNYPTQLRNISGKLLRTNDSILIIEYISDDKLYTETIKTYIYSEFYDYYNSKKDTCFKLINEEIAYLYLGSIKSSYFPDIFDRIENTKGLIIDLRCYPSDFVVFSLGKYLMPKKTAFVKFTKTSIKNPGQFTFTENVEVGSKNKKYYKGKVVILVNETTQSQAEYTTMAMRVAPKATVIGSTTAGADGNVSFFYLPGDIKTAISGIGVYYPDGTGTQRVGIIPDIELKPTVEGIKSNRDELLERAIELIEKE